MTWPWTKKDTPATVCPNCKPVTPIVPSLMSEGNYQQMAAESRGTSSEAIKQNAESLVRVLRNEAARGDLPGHTYSISKRTFKTNSEGIESTASVTPFSWPRADAEKVREELGKYVPIDRLKLDCNGKCSIYFDATY